MLHQNKKEMYKMQKRIFVLGWITCLVILIWTPTLSAVDKWPRSTTLFLEEGQKGISGVSTVAPSPDGKTLALEWKFDGYIWDIEGNREIDRFVGSYPLFSPNGKTLATVEFPEIRLRDMETGEIRTIAAPNVRIFTFSPNSKMLAAGVTDNVIKLWNIETGEEIRTFERHTDSITSLAFSPDNKILASSSFDKTIKLFEVESGTLLKTLLTDTHKVTLAFSPDGKTLTSTSLVFGETEVKIWNVIRGKVTATYILGVDTEDRPITDVRRIVLSPDGKLLALTTRGYLGGDLYEGVELWDVERGKKITDLVYPSNYYFYDISFSLDGSVLAVGGKTFGDWSWDTEESIVKLWISSTATPTLLEPANNTVVDTNRAKLMWEDMDGAYYYEVQVAKDENFTEILEEYTGWSSISFPLESKITYWRVRTHGLGGVGDWSSTGSFETSVPVFIKTKIAKQSGIEAIVDIEVEGAKNLSGFQLDLEFEPNLLEVIEVTEGHFLKSDGVSTVWTPPKIDNKLGEITNITSARISPKGADGSGVLASIIFKAYKAGTSPLIIRNIKLSDPFATNIPAVGERGSLTFEATSALKLEAKIDKSIILNVRIEDAVNLHNLSFDLEFEASALEELEVVEGEFLRRDGIDTSFDTRIDNSEGKAIITSRRLEASGINGSGILASITFRIWQGGTFTFHPSNGKLTNPSDTPIFFTSETAKVTVVESPAWDVNKDYVVNTQDIVILGINFDKKITGNPRLNPDVKRDGVVDVFDVVLIATHFGEEYSAVPQAGAAPLFVKRDVHSLPSPTAAQRVVLQNLYEKLNTYPDTDASVTGVKRLLETLLQQSELALPKTTRLAQNYPNPFNPETWIPFELAEDADVSIQIYDATGRLVRILSLGYKPAGYYLTTERGGYWDGRNHSGEQVSSGLYFYTLTAGKFTATKKLVILK